MKDYKYDYYLHYKLCIPKTVYSEHGLCGIKTEQGDNTLACVLQCLSHVLPLTDYILSNKFQKNQLKRATIKYNSFRHMYTEFLDDTWYHNKLISIKHVKKHIDTCDKDILGFFRYILYTLHESMKLNIDMEVKGEGDLLHRESLEAWINLYKNDYSVIKDMFYGLTRKFETFSILEFSNKDKTLEAMIKNEYTNTFWTLPNHLIFSFDDGAPVFELNLDMTQCISVEKNDRNVYKYFLTSIVYDNGQVEPRYTVACKSINDKWFHYKNEDVDSVTEFEIEQLVSPSVKILVYTRMFLNRNQS